MSNINAQQARLVRRAVAVQSYLINNSHAYAGLSPLVNQVNALTANNAAITPLIKEKQVSGEGATGATEEKNSLKAAIAKEAGDVCAFAADYALTINDRILYKSINYTASDVVHLRDAEVLGFITAVVSVVTPLLSQPDFAIYPVTADTLTALAEKADTFNSNLGKAARMNSSSNIASGDITTLLKNIQGNLNRIKRFMNYLKGDNSTFVKGYRDACVVNYNNIRHSGIEGTIVNSNTGGPVAGVTVTLQGGRNTKKTTTDMYGTYSISPFAQGKCKLTITATGYQKKTEDVTIERGKISEVNTALLSQVLEMKTA